MDFANLYFIEENSMPKTLIITRITKSGIVTISNTSKLADESAPDSKPKRDAISPDSPLVITSTANINKNRKDKTIQIPRIMQTKINSTRETILKNFAGTFKLLL